MVAWFRGRGLPEPTVAETLSGGCISTVLRLRAGNGTAILKRLDAAPAGMYAAEAAGLRALSGDGCPTVPGALLVGEGFLLIEDLRPAPRGPRYWERLGEALARLHARTSPRFGFDGDNWLGASPQPNGWMADGHAFHAERRLRHFARLAEEDGHRVLARVERLCGRLRDLVPEQPASLLHGDLWSGNALTDAHGGPALIDPAAHFGWAEAELAMTRLFGGFPPAFQAAYAAARPFAPGFEERLPLLQLHHLLNHLHLFGAGYLGQVDAVLRRHGC